MHSIGAGVGAAPPWTLLVLLLLLPGCQTTAPLPPVNLSEPGWKLHEGQALWRSSHDASEIAGEILVANHPDGRTWMQFIKTPLPLITAQMNGRRWQIEFIPEKRMVAGHDQPPARFIWLYLLRALNGVPSPAPMQFQKTADGSWRLENKTNGEGVNGYLNP